MRRVRTGTATETMSSGTEALLLAMAEPLVALAAAQNVPLPQLQQVVEEAYFAHLYRSQTVARAAEQLAISRRKACQISKRVKLRASTPTELDILRALATGEVQNERTLMRMTRIKSEILQTALRDLMQKAHVEKVRGGFRLARAFTRVVNDDAARLARGLSDSLKTVSKVVLSRIGTRKSDTAMARVLVFPAPRAVLQNRIDLMFAELMTMAKELDAAATNTKERSQCSLSVFVALEEA